MANVTIADLFIANPVLTPGPTVTFECVDTLGDSGAVTWGELKSTLTEPIPLTYLDTDITLAGDSNTKVASQKAAKSYIDTADALRTLINPANSSTSIGWSGSYLSCDSSGRFQLGGLYGYYTIGAGLTPEIQGTLAVSSSVTAYSLTIGTTGSFDGGTITTNGSGSLTAQQFIGGGASLTNVAGTITFASGWSANGDTGSNTFVIPNSGTNSTTCGNLDVLSPSAGTLLMAVAEQVKALRAAMNSLTWPNN